MLLALSGRVSAACSSACPLGDVHCLWYATRRTLFEGDLALGGRLATSPPNRSNLKQPSQSLSTESFADDLGTGQGVVLSRAAALLRSIETYPLAERFVRNGPFHEY